MTTTTATPNAAAWEAIMQAEDPSPSLKLDAPPRYLLTLDEAQQALGGISRESFNAYVRPDVGIIYLGRRPFVPAAELERYVAERASRLSLRK